jgi:hypothetical protein
LSAKLLLPAGDYNQLGPSAPIEDGNMASSSWRIDSFHIGLGTVGDSAIHLLVEQPSGGDVGLVQFALLVDGGERRGAERIMDTIGKIEDISAYNLSPLSSAASPALKFNAVVISHWDTDHWRGVLLAMKNDIQRQIPPEPSSTDYEVSFFQYDRTTSPRTPKTIIYCPAYGTPSKGCHFEPKPSSAEMADVNMVIPKTGDLPKLTITKVARARFEPEDTPAAHEPSLIGANLITGELLPLDTGSTTKKTYEAVTNPSLLTQKNPPAQAGQPGIYVVAVSERCIGKPPDGLGVVRELGGTPKNVSSLACMIIWPGTPSRLSHYFAGDMHWDLEERIVEWTGTTGTRAAAGSWVTTAKTSHHGAKSSTPISMLSKFNPRNLIASVGERYGHPSESAVDGTAQVTFEFPEFPGH